MCRCFTSAADVPPDVQICCFTSAAGVPSDVFHLSSRCSDVSMFHLGCRCFYRCLNVLFHLGCRCSSRCSNVLIFHLGCRCSSRCSDVPPSFMFFQFCGLLWLKSQMLVQMLGRNGGAELLLILSAAFIFCFPSGTFPGSAPCLHLKPNDSSHLRPSTTASDVCLFFSPVNICKKGNPVSLLGGMETTNVTD